MFAAFKPRRFRADSEPSPTKGRFRVEDDASDDDDDDDEGPRPSATAVITRVLPFAFGPGRLVPSV
jgi:hypothetical protein